MPTEVKMWKTSDDKLHYSAGKAQAHEDYLRALRELRHVGPLPYEFMIDLFIRYPLPKKD